MFALAVEEDTTINPLISSFVSFDRSRPDQPKCPPLKLIGILRGQRCGIGQGRWLPHDLIAHLCPKGILEPMLDEGDGQMGDVDANPLTVPALDWRDGGTTATEGIKHDIAFVTTGLNDAF
jgi:hypothetical protein